MSERRDTPPDTGSRADKTADMRAQIFAAARDVLAEDGPAQLSLREVARRAGVSHQAPYHHFPTKKDLLNALALQGFIDLDTAMAEAQAAASDVPRDQLVAAGIGYFLHARRNPEVYRLMMSREFCDPMPPSQEHDDAFGRLVRAVEAARVSVGKGGLRVAPDAVMADAMVCWANVHGLASFASEGVIGLMAEGKDELAYVRPLLVRGVDALLAAPG